MIGKNLAKESIHIIKTRRKKWTYVVLIITFALFFLLASFSGNYLAANDKKTVDGFVLQLSQDEAFKYFLSLYKEGKFIETFAFIFTHNLNVVLLNFVLGITFILPLLLTAFNGLFSGLLFGISSYVPGNLVLIDHVGFFSVLILELAATTLTAVEGVYLSYSFINPRKIWKTDSRFESLSKTFKQNLRVLLLAAFLLLLAGLIETAFIYNQSLRFVQPIAVSVI